jgi:hypothetical protein
MKNFRFLLFIFAAILAPVAMQAASNAPITITIPAGPHDFHPVYDGESANIRLFNSPGGNNAVTFDVHPDTSYEVWGTVNGVYMLIGHVSWNASGVMTYVPL